MVSFSQKSSPFFFLLQKVPYHTLPEVMADHNRAYSSRGVMPDLRIRGFLPQASSDAYPVTLVNFGFTYSIFPLASVLTMDTGLCSMAEDSLRRSSSAALRSVIFCALPRSQIGRSHV